MAALPLIVFDVNETLLDLTTMEPTFERIFRDKGAMRLWFANFIMYSSALTVAGCYVLFTDIGSAVMKMLADTRGIRIEDADKKELVEKFSMMPPCPEVPGALLKLRASRIPAIHVDGQFAGGADASARTRRDRRFLRASFQCRRRQASQTLAASLTCPGLCTTRHIKRVRDRGAGRSGHSPGIAEAGSALLGGDGHRRRRAIPSELCGRP